MIVDDIELDLPEGQQPAPDESLPDEVPAVAAPGGSDVTDDADLEAETVEDLLLDDDPLKATLVRLRASLAPLLVATKIKPSDPSALESLERFVAKMSCIDDRAAKVQMAIDDAGSVCRALRAARLEHFAQNEAAYVRAVRETGALVVEGDRGWRVGPVELRTDKVAGKVQGRYNREVVVPWASVKGPESLAAVHEQVTRKLASVALDADELASVLWTAYRNCVKSGQDITAKGTVSIVSLVDLYLETRLELLRGQLIGGKTARKLSRHVDFPLWAFLHNLDRYRALGSAVPPGQRLGFQTGSQSESGKRGLVMNGLQPNDQYKVLCYAFAVGS